MFINNGKLNCTSVVVESERIVKNEQVDCLLVADTNQQFSAGSRSEGNMIFNLKLSK